MSKTKTKTDARQSHAQRKAAQRAEKRAAGYKEVSVWIRPDQAEALRDFADSLPKPTPKIDPNQTTIFDTIGSPNG